MTTTTRQAPTAPPPVEYPFPYARGAYVAQVEDRDGRYGIARRFLHPAGGNKSKGRAVYKLAPGWYVTRTARHKPEQLIAVTSTGLPVDLGPAPTGRDALRLLGKAARRGETLDTPGAYRGRYCWCGQDATAWQDRDGRARCDTHHKPTGDDIPDPTEPPALEDTAPDQIPPEWLEEWSTQ